MSKIINVKRFARGAFYDDGTPVICITCRIEKKQALVADRTGRRRANQAVVTAIKVSNGSRLPVGYCEPHDELKEN